MERQHLEVWIDGDLATIVSLGGRLSSVGNGALTFGTPPESATDGFYGLIKSFHLSLDAGERSVVWNERGDPYKNIVASDGNDAIVGSDANNNIHGLGGEDTLDGRGGDDRLFGGAGGDSIGGGAGNDLLDGGTGSDTLYGGTGNDRYVVDDVHDTIVGEIAVGLDGGTDTVKSWVDWTLQSNVEVLRLQGSANLNGTGNSASETLVGNTGNNALLGRGGADLINGREGNDKITGGGGSDTIVGDDGSDTFVYVSISDSYAGAQTRDFINGFIHGQDRIDLSAIDANPYLEGDQAFSFIGEDLFGGAGTSSAGQLRYASYGGNWTIVEADWNGDGTAEMEIFVNLANYMSDTDFVL
jgi:Ca2+-binding RTX toxin-like protein